MKEIHGKKGITHIKELLERYSWIVNNSVNDLSNETYLTFIIACEINDLAKELRSLRDVLMEKENKKGKELK